MSAQQQAQLLNQVANAPNMTWDQKVSYIAQYYKTDAATAASLLGPYYQSQANIAFEQKTEQLPPTTRNFLYQMANLVKTNRIEWSQAVGHVATQLGIPLGDASHWLSEYIKNF